MVKLKSILISNSGVNNYTGGGIVSLNLLEVLREISEVKLLLSNQHFKDSKYEDIPAFCLDPQQFGYDDPFFYDYFARSIISNEDYDLAMIYGCPFNITVEKLKKDTFCKVICDLAPHNIAISMEEHLRLPPHTYPYPHLTNNYLRNLYLKQLRLADKVIVHSHSSAEYIKKEANLEEIPLVIPHGCSLPDDIPEYPEQFSPGYFGSLGKDKGIVYLIIAIINTNLDLFIGGREAQSFSMEEKYMPHFHVIGEIHPSEFYTKVSVGVFPSIVEGFGICGLEAMSYGRPIITTPGTGVSELMTDGKEGFIIPIRDLKAIADKLLWFKDNPSEIKRMGTEARKTAKKYTWDKIKKQYVEVCNAVCSVN
jgi:glycosyltransferase involved in cell wall biosynthesis